MDPKPRGVDLLEPVTIITATGNRPVPLELCAKYVTRQTYKGPIQWIVVDDGTPISSIKHALGRVSYTRIVPAKAWAPGNETLRTNLLHAFREVLHDLIFFFEDDDWYAPDYLATQIQLMGEFSLIGEAPALYYNLPARRYLELQNNYHASLCQTGMRRFLLPLMTEICTRSSDPFVDLQLWERARGLGILRGGRRCIGMKGLPGRRGLGMGHDPDFTNWKMDLDLSQLRSWIGEDANTYRLMV